MGKTKICRHCGNEIPADAQKCKYCKKELELPNTKDMFCKKCKAPVNVDDNFCQHCGAIFNIPDFEPPAKHNIHGIPYHIGILLTALAVGFAITTFATSGKDTTIGGMTVYYLISFICSEIFLYVYFLPSILAIENNKQNVLLLYVCNLLFGATIIGWFIALVLAIRSEEG